MYLTLLVRVYIALEEFGPNWDVPVVVDQVFKISIPVYLINVMKAVKKIAFQSLLGVEVTSN